jgi:hypothetical protein
MSEIRVENGLRFLAAISRDHLREFIDLVHTHMGPAAEPQLLIHSDETPVEGIFLNQFHMNNLSPLQNRIYNSKLDRGEL